MLGVWSQGHKLVCPAFHPLNHLTSAHGFLKAPGSLAEPPTSGILSLPLQYNMLFLKFFKDGMGKEAGEGPVLQPAQFEGRSDWCDEGMKIGHTSIGQKGGPCTLILQSLETQSI